MPVDNVIVLRVLDNLQNSGDDAIDFGTGTSDDDDILIALAVLLADTDGDQGILTQDGSENTATGTDDVLVPFLGITISEDLTHEDATYLLDVQSLRLDIGGLLGEALDALNGGCKHLLELGLSLLLVSRQIRSGVNQ